VYKLLVIIPFVFLIVLSITLFAVTTEGYYLILDREYVFPYYNNVKPQYAITFLNNSLIFPIIN
jgi:hypothetical protein